MSGPWTAPETGWYLPEDEGPRLLGGGEVRDVMTAQFAGLDVPRMTHLEAGAPWPQAADDLEEDPAVTWLRRRIAERRFLAENTIALGSSAVWDQPSTGVLVTGEPGEQDAWDGTWSLGDSTLVRLMVANDPQDTLARCDAETALLTEHGGEHMCFEVSADGNTWSWWIGDCRVMTALAGAYRHHEGWAEHWGTGQEGSQ